VSEEPVVGVVVLTWNGREDTLACLGSLAATTGATLRVIVVDNGSSDGTASAVRAGFPDVELVRSEQNLGFAGGNNLGIRRALELGVEHVLVLNNDTEVEPGAVAALADEARRTPDAAALCAKLLYAEPPDRIWFAGADFDPRRGYNGRQRGYGEADGPAFSAVAETDRACGAAMLVPRPVLDRVGSFDPDLFLYSEDTEWSLRARAAGYRLLVVPAARVRHKVSVAAGGESSPTTLYYGMRNTLVVCERHAPLGSLRAWRRRIVLLCAHLAQAVLSSRRRAGLRAVRDGWLDARAGRLGPRPHAVAR
jgi:GT2 family glycosyltransferase